MLRVIYKKKRTEPAVFSKPNRTELEKSILHIPTVYICIQLIHICIRICIYIQLTYVINHVLPYTAVVRYTVQWFTPHSARQKITLDTSPREI